jgi:hypothetical protein
MQKAPVIADKGSCVGDTLRVSVVAFAKMPANFGRGAEQNLCFFRA